MISGNVSKSVNAMGVNLDRLWYVPDGRLRTKSAANKAVVITEWIRHQRKLKEEPREEELFVAMHTCAYRAARRSRKQRITSQEREKWIRRWQIVREFIVEKNLGLVYSMIGRFGSKKMDEDDMLSDAMFGLSRAVDRYNPWRGYRFSTYACNVISRALIRRGQRESYYREVFPVQHDVSFEKAVEVPDPEKALYVERLDRALKNNLGELTDLESMVISRRFTADRQSRHTFQEIGKSVGLSKERVRQIQNVALKKLRNVLNEDPVLQEALDVGGAHGLLQYR